MRLIRIRTLADAGVPLARVQELLDAGPEEFADGVQEIDKDLRAEIRRLQGNRQRLARLAAGDHLALPQSVVGYLDRLRGLGVEERYIELERGRLDHDRRPGAARIDADHRQEARASWTTPTW